MSKFTLKRVKQCDKCPWKKSTNPHDIPNGYCETKHCNLSSTISSGLQSLGNNHAMACHETDNAHCIGWLNNQLGAGNNIGLRMQMLNCTNIGKIRLDGEQHENFEQTLPPRKVATYDCEECGYNDDDVYVKPSGKYYDEMYYYCPQCNAENPAWECDE